MCSCSGGDHRLIGRRDEIPGPILIVAPYCEICLALRAGSQVGKAADRVRWSAHPASTRTSKGPAACERKVRPISRHGWVASFPKPRGKNISQRGPINSNSRHDIVRDISPSLARSTDPHTRCMVLVGYTEPSGVTKRNWEMKMPSGVVVNLFIGLQRHGIRSMGMKVQPQFLPATAAVRWNCRAVLRP